MESKSMNRSFRLGTLLFATATMLVAAAFSQAQQPGPPPGGFGGPGGPGGFFGGGGILGLAARDEVQQELQLVDEQKDKVRAIADDARNRARDEMRGIFEQLRDLNDEERRAKFEEIRTKLEAMNADMEKELDKVLLPHQLERLKQIDLQNKIRQRGSSALTSGDVASALNLTDEQRQKLEKRAAEVQEELQTKIRKLQAEARQKMIDVLTPEQQAQLQKMMGDNFDLRDQGFGGFRGRFDRGNRGSDGGGERRRGGERRQTEGKSAT
jgi:Spy/CpxP family protein refolding chaperone